MAAYAAAQCLTTLLEQVQLYQDRDPVLIDEQLKHLASIREKVCSFQSYLETYHGLRSEDAQDLEVRISDACYEAEDEIESYIVDYNHLKKEYNGKVCFPLWPLKERANTFSHGLQKVINAMDSIEKKVTEIKKKGTLEDQQGLFFTPVGSIRPPLTTQSDMFVGRDDLLISVIDKIVGRQPNRQVIPITGMGGIGKTMFARNVYDSPHAKEHFDICGWVTISQVYDIGKLMLCLLRDIKALIEGEGANLAVHELGLRLHKHLSGRRYLVVLDDMWSIDAWSVIQRFLPDNSNGSRVMVTSRLLHVTNCIDPSNHFQLDLLDESESWKLLEKKAFGEEKCPPELKEVGKRIAINCKGLPLAVVVIGGLLAKSEMILQDWEKISANISETVNSAEDGSCMDILSLSYNHLPVYLKPCFLYMGIFAEDEVIRVSRLINLWVSEGFLKPIHGKCMEEVAEIYLLDLIERNLIFASGRKFDGVVKDCKTHDLLRDLCLREAKRCRFVSFITNQSPAQDISSHRRIGVHCMTSGDLPPEVCRALQSASFLRSVLDTSQGTMGILFGGDVDSDHLLQLKSFKLMRVLEVTKNYPCEVIFRLVNSRHISYLPEVREKNIFSSLNLFWNIQTLVMGFILNSTEYIVPSIIWELAQLRQIKIHDFVMPEPPSRKPGSEIVVQKHLQILLMVRDFRLTEEILNGRPNIKKLKITQGWVNTGMRFSDYSLKNLVLLDKLQSFYCWFGEQYSRTEVLKGIKFPLLLKKLTLVKCPFEWDDMAATVGDLPQLEVLDLKGGCCGEEWNPLDGQFLRLKRLSIGWKGPSQWNADSTHFPVLEELHLSMIIMQNMREIPRGIGETETLRSIHVYDCCDSLVTSAKEILEEQEMLGNDDFELIVKQHGTGESNEHDTDEEHDRGEEHEGHEEDDRGNWQGAGAA